MRAGWLRFGRNRAALATRGPDKPVTAPRAWLLGVVIVASTAALLGTSDDSPPPKFATYTFERTGIDGGFVELTRDQPSATFFVTVRADTLGPDQVSTTEAALMDIDGTITTSGLADGATAPFVSVKLGSPDSIGVTEKVVLDSYSQQQPLIFSGDCQEPTTGVACRARFTLEVTRKDDGDGNGVVRFDWLFDASSRIEQPATEDSKVGPLDPPWTIEVSQP
jgi:hypothetical protein